MRTKYHTWADVRAEFDRRCQESQKKLAEQIGFSAAYINDVAQGRRPLTETMAIMLGFMKCPDRFERTSPMIPRKGKARK